MGLKQLKKFIRKLGCNIDDARSLPEARSRALRFVTEFISR